ncbi:DUF4113 domain-containing protein [bacterium]|nr:DUF4113 domain-containing protein [bacterium]
MPQVQWLVLDLNSFFASCEQQENPELRGKPVGVIAVETDYTSILAASYEAKRYGIKTGTGVKEARAMCPGMRFVLSRPKTYLQYHHRILDAIDTCIPVERIMSIDEVACRLMGPEKELENAIALAKKIKKAITTQVGECLTSSVGLAPNILLAKLGSDMQKPDGLTVLTKESLPQSIEHLPLQAIPGIGPRMARRLYKCGIGTITQLYACDSMQLRAIWGNVGGARFHQLLHGEQIEPQDTNTSTIGHQHVLEPNLRNWKDAYEITRGLLTKAAERLRSKGYYARNLSIHVKLADHAGYWAEQIRFNETQDTSFLLRQLEEAWRLHPPNTRPHRTGVVLHGLVAAQHHQDDLFTAPKRNKVMQTVDALNRKFGRNTITFGVNEDVKKKIGGDKIAFSRVPGMYEAQD